MKPGRAARACDSLASLGESGEAGFETLGERAHRKDVAREDVGHELEFPRADVRPGERNPSFDGRPGIAHLFSEGDP